MSRIPVENSLREMDVLPPFHERHESEIFRTGRILILTVPHGAAHQRIADALKRALLGVHPDLAIEIVNALDHFPRWFSTYYNSYEIPLKYWPALWGWIENMQHTQVSTGPGWLFRKAARTLSQFLYAFHADIVIVTEVGICELVAMAKRSTETCFRLVASPPGVDIDRAWAQPEVDLYAVAPGEATAQLRALNVPDTKILTCGVPVDPLFGSLPSKAAAREHLQIGSNVPLVVVEFGGTGHGKPRRILAELEKLQQPVQVVFIAGKNKKLKLELLHRCAGHLNFRVFGWVDNIHEWMAAADILVGKPGGTTMVEAINSGLPLLATDPLPGEERRNCDLIEEWGVGYWVRYSQNLAPTIARLLADQNELDSLRQRALALARPCAAQEAAESILKLWRPSTEPSVKRKPELK
jgi:processive 1,2-diacylglycerol beta-glucosyltransferase